MKTLGMIIREYRQEHNLSLRDFATRCQLSHSYIDKLEKGIDPRNGKPVEPTLTVIEQIAHAIHKDKTDLLEEIGYLNKQGNIKLSSLTKKEERDIAKDLEKTLEELENSEDALMFDGEPIDEHTKEMIRISLENSMRMAKQLAKQKFTPNKYKKD
ncbi:TPA: helix-turn-helix transcriptional regulator [Bacillus cereus]|uniref:Helix-turn-helix protein n=1 Tax=Bacillus paranthracis TaxID=2026186 RepID=A0A9X8X3H8_9BACI|nr:MULTISPECIES: helix-turn-helix transcriptional regulator [Bacillus cereus group]MBL3880875.1 helix-turn-helix domain-containing protein [Bacillus cereus]MDA2666935.1 helix-turn-helix transcriptional regulator [Bacillus cereus group sp. Bc032]MDA2677639.1 helix-turn-helix transcriptional regulator [Bacillus cereus group sp. Bc031]MDA2683144.1 helix-turn-helix transcriptional regulator [Bacillus cereus group sp. Bc029]MDA2688590.1 helix-turn-helix transcriptional regulator [Bacillus cereus gr